MKSMKRWGNGGGRGTPRALVGVLVLGTVAVMAASGATPSSATEPGPDAAACAALLDVPFADGSRVLSAAPVAATGPLPGLCVALVHVPERITIAVLLPATGWNGRFVALGNGGYSGSLAIGLAGDSLGGPSSRRALAAGYAVAMTDAGHQGTPFTAEWVSSPFGRNDAQIEDYVHRANHELAVKAKTLIQRFYGKGPNYSYWNGCSTGGREGVAEATRYPDDFDGIVAGAPAVNFPRFVPGEMWPQVVMHEENHLLPQCKGAAVEAAVAAACDSTDGLQDGLFDAIRCDFDPQTLLGVSTPCGPITAADVSVLAKIWQGPRAPDGRFLWYGPQPGTDLGSLPGLTVAHVVGDGAAAIDGFPFPISTDWFRFWLGKGAGWDWHSLSYEQFARDFEESRRMYDDVIGENDPSLAAFRAAGGKLILWHGMVDQLIPAKGTVDYFKRMSQATGGASTFARLFLVPNVGHCGMEGRDRVDEIFVPGNGPQIDDPLAAVVEWVESGRAPATLVARLAPGAGVNNSDREMTRKVCPYPSTLQYRGVGDPLAAESFTCVRPPE